MALDAARRAPPADALHIHIRLATASDLDALVLLEEAAYDPPRRQTRRSLRRSLLSRQQSVWVVTASSAKGGQALPAGSAGHAAGREPATAGRVDASLVLWHHPQALRVYGVTVHPDRQGHGVGARLMDHAEGVAQREHLRRVVLEADAARPRLVAWYEARGYRRRQRLVDYYAPGRDAWRMEKPLPSP